MRVRDWTAARGKVHDEGKCRVCGKHEGSVTLEAAHVCGREYDARVVLALDVVPLCGGPEPATCHWKYDHRKLDLLPYLTRPEQARAVELLGMVQAYRRVTGSREPVLRVPPHSGGSRT